MRNLCALQQKIVSQTLNADSREPMIPTVIIDNHCRYKKHNALLTMWASSGVGMLGTYTWWIVFFVKNGLNQKWSIIPVVWYFLYSAFLDHCRLHWKQPITPPGSVHRVPWIDDGIFSGTVVKSYITTLERVIHSERVGDRGFDAFVTICATLHSRRWEHALVRHLFTCI